MKPARLSRLIGLQIMTLAFAGNIALSHEGTLPPAPIHQDEGGPVIVQGTGSYTFPYFDIFLPDPYITMVDLSGLYIDDSHDRYPSPRSQYFGTLTSDPNTSPFTYVLALPIVPQGEPRDLDNDLQEDSGVQVFALSLASNTWGGPFLEERDFYTVGLLCSLVVSGDAETLGEITGGMLLIYAAEPDQGFPTGFGADGHLFTADDPAALVPAGYTLVDLDSDPFRFSRPQTADIPLIEGQLAQLDDLSQMGMTESFLALVELLRHQYAFTDYLHIDWDALSSQHLPEVQAAEAQDDYERFRQILLDFAYHIPDPHIYGLINPRADWSEAFGGLGFSLVRLDDGRIVAYEVQPQSPSEGAGVLNGAEILMVNGQKIEDIVDRTVPLSLSSIGAPHMLELEKLRWALRYPEGTPVSLLFRNPGESPREIHINAYVEVMSLLRFPLTPVYDAFALPIETELLEGGYLRVSFNSFADDLPLIVHLWERMIENAILRDVPGIIIDLRSNSGGSAYIADVTPAYFFDEELLIGQAAFYSAQAGSFVTPENLETYFQLPPANMRYHGPVVVLVGPDCASACETFAYNMSLENRATIVGFYATVGAGGSVVPVSLPGDLQMSYTRGRSLDAEGNIHIQNIGVVPDVRVPLTEQTLFADEDALLHTAIHLLNGQALPFAPTQTQTSKPFIVSTLGIVTVVPVDWVRMSDTAYANPEGGEVLIVATMQIADLDQAVSGLATQGIHVPEEYELHQYGAYTWRIYDLVLEDMPARIAMTGGDSNTTYLVVIMARTSLPEMNTEVFMPALENFNVQP